MTSTLSRPPLSRPAARSRQRRDPLRTGVPAALWAVAAGLVATAVPVLLGWAADSRSGAGAAEALAVVGQVWLLAHGTALDVPGGTLDLLPLGLLALPAALLVRAGRHAATLHPVPGLPEAARVTAGIAAPYAVLTAVVAGVSAHGGTRPVALQALVGGLVVAAVFGGLGVLRAASLLPALRARVPESARTVLTGATAALGVLLAAGALVTGGSLLVHGSRAADLASATDPGLVGGLLLVLLGVALVPVAVVWGACWLAGPGVAVGVGTAVSPFSVELGPVPALPLLAALPSGPPPGWVAVLALAVPVAAGALAGWLVLRAGGALREVLLVGPVTGAALAALAVLAAGPVGGARLAEVGPTAWLVGLVVAVEVGLPALAVLGARRWQLARPAR